MRRCLTGADLEVELTESGVVTDFERVNDVFRTLRAEGVRIAVDDFGTGYSSLTYLHELLFDTLKIDRAFISGLPGNSTLAIVQSVIGVAHALHKQVVAEGIELDAHVRMLRALDCDIGQGYLFARPKSATDLAAWVLERGALTTATGSIRVVNG